MFDIRALGLSWRVGGGQSCFLKLFGSNQEKVFFSKRTLYFSKIGSVASQPTIICSKSTVETLEQGVKYVQS